MDKSKYKEKCLIVLENGNFKTLGHDPTKKKWGKNTMNFMKMKNRLSPQEYLCLYPSGSCPGKFYGTAEVQKISENDTVNELPIRSIVSKFWTVT